MLEIFKEFIIWFFKKAHFSYDGQIPPNKVHPKRIATDIDFMKIKFLKGNVIFSLKSSANIKTWSGWLSNDPKSSFLASIQPELLAHQTLPGPRLLDHPVVPVGNLGCWVRIWPCFRSPRSTQFGQLSSKKSLENNSIQFRLTSTVLNLGLNNSWLGQFRIEVTRQPTN